MYSKYFTLFFLACLSMFKISGQELTKEEKEHLDYKVAIFSSEEKELQKLWYEDQMDLMKLKGELREDYQKIVVYHAYKMERLDDRDSDFNEKEIHQRLQQQVDLMHKDVKPILSDKQYETHLRTWKVILNAVYLKKKGK
ncbi:hypothetical protein [Flavivirga spongiicola]|uniref:Uncharacterized protein n=1 Tax=Flavivirga spongiicola TaxID=421621 RepID=A0ABU7XUT8_9FLAO|nr:hypothetical protein [Flavivirga sp. MEBiC05379]MDO5979553.1 hypothetical protein [Flavivirga sp. MEBiC05379]